MVWCQMWQILEVGMVDHIREQHDDRELLGAGHTRPLANILQPLL